MSNGSRGVGGPRSRGVSRRRLTKGEGKQPARRTGKLRGKDVSQVEGGKRRELGSGRISERRVPIGKRSVSVKQPELTFEEASEKFLETMTEFLKFETEEGDVDKGKLDSVQREKYEAFDRASQQFAEKVEEVGHKFDQGKEVKREDITELVEQMGGLKKGLQEVGEFIKFTKGGEGQVYDAKHLLGELGGLERDLGTAVQTMRFLQDLGTRTYSNLDSIGEKIKGLIDDIGGEKGPGAMKDVRTGHGRLLELIDAAKKEGLTQRSVGELLKLANELKVDLEGREGVPDLSKKDLAELGKLLSRVGENVRFLPKGKGGEVEPERLLGGSKEADLRANIGKARLALMEKAGMIAGELDNLVGKAQRQGRDVSKQKQLSQALRRQANSIEGGNFSKDALDGFLNDANVLRREVNSLLGGNSLDILRVDPNIQGFEKAMGDLLNYEEQLRALEKAKVKEPVKQPEVKENKELQEMRKLIGEFNKGL